MEKGTVEYCKEIDAFKAKILALNANTDNLINEYAKAETSFRRALAVAEATLKSNGVAVSILKDQAYGDDEVNDSYHRQIVAEKTLRANSEKIDSLEACMNATQSQNKHLTGM